ncbi:MAG: bifunctional hydroxymethylpyrimidine kinase/phosphomethylpyrimidine kinase [Thermodesulfobacteriota bacterium]
MKRVLTIAGSDSGGGAGIQADLKTITVLGEYGFSVLTALTAQNTRGVQGVLDAPIDFIRLQMDSVLSDIGADAAKTGMLARSDIVKAVAARLRTYQVPNLVVDPVMVAASGDRLLAPDAVKTLREELIPLADLVTPNLAEAEVLCGFPVTNPDEMKTAAKEIHKLGPKAVLIKGGHLKDRALDLLFDGRSFSTFETARIETRNTHGTGCTLSAALATFLAKGCDLIEAVRQAKSFITLAIKSGLAIGQGHGPTNPFAWVARWKERDQVLTELKQALDELLGQPLGRLVPEIRSNLGYALSSASGPEDVAAVPGRITQIGDRLVALAEPAFGSSRHIAKVILAAMNHHPGLRSAMNIRYSPEILEACRKIDYTLASFDRSEEPAEVKAREGSSLEWGTGKALAGLAEPPDAVYDLGERGKEPVIRVLGRTPREVVEKVQAIHDQWTGRI